MPRRCPGHIPLEQCRGFVPAPQALGAWRKYNHVPPMLGGLGARGGGGGALEHVPPMKGGLEICTTDDRWA